MRRLVAAFGVAALLVATSSAFAEISIDVPSAGQTVGCTSIVSGKVSGDTNSVWLIVHPYTVANYYVQPKPNVTGDQWRANAYFGERKPEHMGVEYEVRAAAGVTDVLKTGDILADWPRATAYSNIVNVKRGPC